MSQPSSAAVSLDLAGLRVAFSVSENDEGVRVVHVAVSDPLQAPESGAEAELRLPPRATFGPTELRGSTPAPSAPTPSSNTSEARERLLDPAGQPVAEPSSDLLLGARRIGALGGLSAEDRIRRAHHLGQVDRAIADRYRDGRTGAQLSWKLPGQKTAYYAVLYSTGTVETPLVTRSYDRYRSAALDNDKSVSRSFASRVEVDVYLTGAGYSPLPEV